MDVSRITILQYLIMVPLIQISLRLFGLKPTWNALRMLSFPARRTFSETGKEVRNNLAGLKRAMTITPMNDQCLARSLVLWWQLERRDLHGTINIGVQKRKIFKAHAWVEYEGQILNAGKKVRERYKSIAQFQQPADMK